jgi:hypothetical protein
MEDNNKESKNGNGNKPVLLRGFGPGGWQIGLLSFAGFTGARRVVASAVT